MKPFWMIITILSFLACNRKNEKPDVPPNIQVLYFDSALKKTNEGWIYGGKPFSGYILEKDKDQHTICSLPVIEGKKGGDFKQWWPNGNYRYLFHYKNDLYEGTQQIFFPDGRVQEESNYLSGEKEGLQRMWDDSGRLISNYTIKNKKLYGVINIKSCMPATGH